MDLDLGGIKWNEGLRKPCLLEILLRKQVEGLKLAFICVGKECLFRRF